jgi:predicted HAD superfamily Cof-like phosphohydrolase
MTNADKVLAFHRAYGVPLAGRPYLPPPERRILRMKLLAEELDELDSAMLQGDLIEIADAIADLLYVTYGTAHEFGIPIDAVFTEVHRSNMTKLDDNGKPILRKDGKVLKGPRYDPPRIAGILRNVASFLGNP